jgi:glycosyltransferase involved in cell wall biosynthesis
MLCFKVLMAEVSTHLKQGFPNLVGKRVLMLFPHIVNPGGALFYTLRLAQQLQEVGATVSILTLRSKAEFPGVPNGVEVISLNGPLTSSLVYWLQLPSWQIKINRTIAAWRPNVLVPHVFPSNWWGWLYKHRERDMKLVWVCHEPSAFIHSKAWILALRPWWKSLVARILRPALVKIDVSLSRNCDRTVANSCFTAEEMERIYAIVPDAIARPGIDFQEFTCENFSKERIIMTVARLTKFKRVDFLIDVFAEVHNIHPELNFYIIGTGEDETLLRNQVVKLGLESQVIFCGAVNDQKLTELYRSSSLYLHGSVDEPFGMAPLEAIACGTPVFAHNSGGPREFVSVKCGRLIDSLDKMEWAASISAYLDSIASDTNFRYKVRESARPFDWRNSLRPALETIEGLCADRENSRGKTAF